MKIMMAAMGDDDDLSADGMKGGPRNYSELRTVHSDAAATRALPFSSPLQLLLLPMAQKKVAIVSPFFSSSFVTFAQVVADNVNRPRIRRMQPKQDVAKYIPAKK